MIQKCAFSVFALLVSINATAVGWSCRNQWNGRYTFLPTTTNSGKVSYLGPIEIADIANSHEGKADGVYRNFFVNKGFDFWLVSSVGRFSYSCVSVDKSEYWCRPSSCGELPDLILTNCSSGS